jgi:hypothetical protein
MATALKVRVACVVVATALIIGCQSASGLAATQQSAPVSEASCKRDPDPYYMSERRALQVDSNNAESVLRTCRRIADNPGRTTVSELANILYFVGASARELAEKAAPPAACRDENRQQSSAASVCLQEAEDALDRAMALRERFNLARLERARVYRLQAGASQTSADRVAALRDIETLQRDVPDPADPIHVASHFLRAALFIDLHRDGPREAGEVGSAANVRGAATGAAHQDSLPTLTWDSTLRDLAVFADAAQGGDEERRPHPFRQRALEWLAQYSHQIGCLLIDCEAGSIPDVRSDRPLTRDTVQSAIDYFSLAQAAVDASTTTQYLDPRFVETYVRLGQARMHLAGLLGPRGAGNYGCVAETGNAALLTQAESDLQAALRRSANDPEANRNMACVKLALGDADTAGRYAGAALNGSAGYLMLARVQAAREQWTDASTNYGYAASAAGPNIIDARPLIYLEQARARLHTPVNTTVSDEALEAASLDQLQIALDALSSVNASESELAWLVRLERGKLHYWSARIAETEAIAASQYQLALERLASFDQGHVVPESLGDPARAEGLLYLSRIYSESPRANGNNAVRTADEALSIAGTWPYRKQACLARVRFGQVSFPEAGPRAICASGDDAPPGEGVLIQGMYHLRRAFVLRGDDVGREWEDAYRAFTLGLGDVPDVAENRDLRAQLTYGLGTAQYCIGFTELGSQATQSSAAARRFFQIYGIADCPARRARNSGR